MYGSLFFQKKIIGKLNEDGESIDALTEEDIALCKQLKFRIYDGPVTDEDGEEDEDEDEEAATAPPPPPQPAVQIKPKAKATKKKTEVAPVVAAPAAAPAPAPPTKKKTLETKDVLNLEDILNEITVPVKDPAEIDIDDVDDVDKKYFLAAEK